MHRDHLPALLRLMSLLLLVAPSTVMLGVDPICKKLCDGQITIRVLGSTGSTSSADLILLTSDGHVFQGIRATQFNAQKGKLSLGGISAKLIDALYPQFTTLLYKAVNELEPFSWDQFDLSSPSTFRPFIFNHPTKGAFLGGLLNMVNTTPPTIIFLKHSLAGGSEPSSALSLYYRDAKLMKSLYVGVPVSIMEPHETALLYRYDPSTSPNMCVNILLFYHTGTDCFAVNLNVASSYNQKKFCREIIPDKAVTGITATSTSVFFFHQDGTVVISNTAEPIWKAKGNFDLQDDQTMTMDQFLDCGAEGGGGGGGGGSSGGSGDDDKKSSSGWWIILGLLVVGVGGGVYLYKSCRQGGKKEVDDGEVKKKKKRALPSSFYSKASKIFKQEDKKRSMAPPPASKVSRVVPVKRSLVSKATSSVATKGKNRKTSMAYSKVAKTSSAMFKSTINTLISKVTNAKGKGKKKKGATAKRSTAANSTAPVDFSIVASSVTSPRSNVTRRLEVARKRNVSSAAKVISAVRSMARSRAASKR